MVKVYIKDLIGKQYIIPDFQRDYAWTEKNLKRMLEDIKNACIEGKEYLLGPIVVSESLMVIDGQQRLTSLMIILKALGTDSDFLDFENRQHVKDLLSNNKLDGYEGNNETCKKICMMYQFSKSYFEILKEITKEEFSVYLMNKVWFIEKTLAPKMQIQHSFEVLNTAGEQLKAEDIAKAKLIAEMSKLKLEKESELLNFAWLHCYDIENDLPPEVSSKSKDIINAEEFSTLFEKLKDVIQVCGESVKTKLLDVVNAVESGKVYSRTIGGRITDYQSGLYATCLTPYELIDVALKSSINKSIADIKNSDTNVIKDYGDALKVIKSLLLYRIAFDQYVVKRSKGKWNWFASGKVGNQYLEQFIKLESMLAVSGVEASKKMVNVVEKAMEASLREDRPIDVNDIIDELEHYASNRVEITDENLNKGTGTDHFVFHWLDYLLYLNPPEGIAEKAKNFTFQETTSVEHFMPQHLLGGKEHSKEWEKELNNFGNLALITPSSNSRLNNSMPSGKVELADSRETESLKYGLMLSIAKKSGWDVEASRKHGEAMKELLGRGPRK